MYSTNELKPREMLANIASLAATRSAAAVVSLRVAFSRASTLVVLLTTLTGIKSQILRFYSAGDALHFAVRE
jgi:hypothetical protein